MGQGLGAIGIGVEGACEKNVLTDAILDRIVSSLHI